MDSYDKPITQGIVKTYTGNRFEIGYFIRSIINEMFTDGNVVYPIINRSVLPAKAMFNEVLNVWHTGCYSRTDHVYPRNVWGYDSERVYNMSHLDFIDVAEDNHRPINEKFAHISNYTYGYEFETSNGTIPGEECHNKRLIPLFDGSISGYEYVTPVISALNLPERLHEAVTTIRKYTATDKECSIHMHVGGFNPTILSVTKLLKYWFQFQYEIAKYLPYYVYNTELFKASEKSYCKPYGRINDFAKFYKQATGNVLEDDDSLYLDNRYDISEDHKWTVSYRYFNMNIIHLISGSSHKTVEFRFFSPFAKYEELELFTTILTVFLRYVEAHLNDTNPRYKVPIKTMLKEFFDNDMVNKIMYKLNLMSNAMKMSYNFKDYACLDHRIKDYMLDDEQYKKSLFLCVE
jgi:hypothetical protein